MSCCDQSVILYDRFEEIWKKLIHVDEFIFIYLINLILIVILIKTQNSKEAPNLQGAV